MKWHKELEIAGPDKQQIAFINEVSANLPDEGHQQQEGRLSPCLPVSSLLMLNRVLVFDRAVYTKSA